MNFSLVQRAKLGPFWVHFRYRVAEAPTNLLKMQASAGLAQGQCSGFVNRRSGVRIPHPAPYISVSYNDSIEFLFAAGNHLATNWERTESGADTDGCNQTVILGCLRVA
jgi:hypothetical protein